MRWDYLNFCGFNPQKDFKTESKSSLEGCLKGLQLIDNQ